MVGEHVSATRIEDAVATFDPEASNELVRAVCTYRAGKLLFQHGEETSARNADDAIGDKLLDEVELWLKNLRADPNRLDASVLVEQVSKYQETVERMSEALPSWPEIRREELAERIKWSVQELCFFPIMLDFACFKAVAKDLPRIARTAVENLKSCELGVPAGEYESAMRMIRGTSLRLQPQLASWEKSLLVAADLAETLLTRTFANVCGTQDLSVTQSNFSDIRKHFHFRTKLLQGILSMAYVEVDFGVIEYQAAAQEYAHWQESGFPQGDETKRVPYLWHLMEFCDHRYALGDHNDSSLFTPIAVVPDGLLMNLESRINSEVGELTIFLISGEVCSRVVEKHCHSKLADCINGYVSSLSSANLSLASAQTLQDSAIDALMPLVTTGVVGASNRIAESVASLSFDKSHMGSANWPHLQMLSVVKTMVSSVCTQGLYLESLQLQGAHAIDKATVLALLDICSTVHTCVLTGVWLHTYMLEKKAKNHSGTKSPCVEAIRAFKCASASLTSLLSSPVALATSVMPLHLKQNVAYLVQWNTNIAFIASRFVDEAVESQCDAITAAAASLEAKVPKWSALFNQSAMNITMIKKTILQNPHKDKLFGLSEQLKGDVKNLAEWTVIMELEPPFVDDERCAGAAALASSACDEASKCLAVTSACNTFFNFEEHAKGPNIAKSLLAVCTSMDFKLPGFLSDELAKLAASATDGVRKPERKKPRQDAGLSAGSVGAVGALVASAAPTSSGASAKAGGLKGESS